jgi:hypothetical protein
MKMNENTEQKAVDVRAVPLVVQTAPKRIWLQIADDAYSATEAFPDDALDQITWCADSVVDTEVKYVRADLVAELIEAANAVCGRNNPPAGELGHIDFTDALVMLRKAVSRIGTQS